MPAPTALLKPQPGEEATPSDVPLPAADQDEEVLLDAPSIELVPVPSAPVEDMEMVVDEEGRPKFPAAKTTDAVLIQGRKIPIPPNRMTPLKQNWARIYPPLVEHLNLQVRMNVKTKTVELRSTPNASTDALQRGADFVTAFTLGFDVEDAIAMMRVAELYLETFEIKDVKTLQGDHLARAIGRIAGKGGKTKFAIENTSKTRIVLADSKIHILGSFKNIAIARESISSLILGRPPGKVYNNLRTISARMKERF